jgi:cytochrome c biogenesis protein CcmG, thiol:disulfide interchange protein DsbE
MTNAPASGSRKPRSAALKRVLVTIAALVGVQALLVVTYFVFEGPDAVEYRRENRQAPDLAYRTIDGQWHRLSEHRGQPVLVHFWASWCPPCIEELPQVLSLASAGPMRVLALSVDADWKSVRRFLGQEPSTSVGLAGSEEAAEGFQFQSLPRTFLIDAQGVVRMRFDGPRDWTARATRRLLAASQSEMGGVNY